MCVVWGTRWCHLGPLICDSHLIHQVDAKVEVALLSLLPVPLSPSQTQQRLAPLSFLITIENRGSRNPRRRNQGLEKQLLAGP